jgi:hypothetical protein
LAWNPVLVVPDDVFRRTRIQNGRRRAPPRYFIQFVGQGAAAPPFFQPVEMPERATSIARIWHGYLVSP